MPPARMNNVCETSGPRKWKNIFGKSIVIRFLVIKYLPARIRKLYLFYTKNIVAKLSFIY